MPGTLATGGAFRNPSFGMATSYLLSLFWVVNGTKMISVLAASGSNRETITTGGIFVARPRSASQISPWRGFIQDVQNVLFAGPGMQQIERVLIRQSNNFAHAFTYLIGRLRLPFMQSGVQRFKQGFHQDLHLKTILRGSPYAATESTGASDPRFPKRRCWRIRPKRRLYVIFAG
jgi:hypothetical protein